MGRNDSMAQLKWRIDSENYLSNNSKQADKMMVKHFIEMVCRCLDEYCEKYTIEDVKTGKIKYCHSCSGLRSKNSHAAKKLYNHMQEINTKLGNKSVPAQISENDIYQFKIKEFESKNEYRCFGYFLPYDNLFNLIYLDPDHEVYKE